MVVFTVIITDKEKSNSQVKERGQHPTREETARREAERNIPGKTGGVEVWGSGEQLGDQVQGQHSWQQKELERQAEELGNGWLSG